MNLDNYWKDYYEQFEELYDGGGLLLNQEIQEALAAVAEGECEARETTVSNSKTGTVSVPFVKLAEIFRYNFPQTITPSGSCVNGKEYDAESEIVIARGTGRPWSFLRVSNRLRALSAALKNGTLSDEQKRSIENLKIRARIWERLSFAELKYLFAKYNCPERIIADEALSAELPVQAPAKDPEAPAVSEDPVTSEAEKSSVDSRGLSVNILSAFILEQAKYSKELSCTPKKTAAIRQNRYAGSSCIGLVSAVHRKLNNRWYWQCGPPPDLPAAG